MAGFKSTFAAARKAGKKEFTWNGKSYNTKLKAEGSKKSSLPAKTNVIPKSRPSNEKVPLPKSRDSAILGKSSSRPSFSGMAAVSNKTVDKPKRKDLNPSRDRMNTASMPKFKTGGPSSRTHGDPPESGLSKFLFGGREGRRKSNQTLREMRGSRK
jgi:hypothetical protein